MSQPRSLTCSTKEPLDIGDIEQLLARTVPTRLRVRMVVGCDGRRNALREPVEAYTGDLPEACYGARRPPRATAAQVSGSVRRVPWLCEARGDVAAVR